MKRIKIKMTDHLKNMSGTIGKLQGLVESMENSSETEQASIWIVMHILP